VCQSRQLENYLANLPRKPVDKPPFRDLRGTLHVHSKAGGHSLGTYREIVEAAKLAGYQYLFITEHPRRDVFFPRFSDPELVIIYGWEEEREDLGRTLRSEDSKVSILAYCDQAPVPVDVSAIEIFNLFESARASQGPFAWVNWFYHQFAYSDLFFFHIWEINQKRFQLWDETVTQRPLAGYGGNDAHQNIGLLLQTTSGDKLMSIMVDPYLSSFQLLTNHIFVPHDSEITQDRVLDSLRDGSSYMAFEKIADPTGFSFHARWQGRVFPMGAEVPTGSKLVFQAPIPAQFRLLHRGNVVRKLEGTRFQMETDKSGAYRVEVYPLSPPSLIKDKPWIVSNPIYVR
jgi:hypothetical protein